MSDLSTLIDLQGDKNALELEAHLIREALHALAAARPDGWRAEFERAQSELMAVTKSIGRLDGQIRKLVEATIVTTEDDTDA